MAAVTIPRLLSISLTLKERVLVDYFVSSSARRPLRNRQKKVLPAFDGRKSSAGPHDVFIFFSFMRVISSYAE